MTASNDNPYQSPDVVEQHRRRPPPGLKMHAGLFVALMSIALVSWFHSDQGGLVVSASLGGILAACHLFVILLVVRIVKAMGRPEKHLKRSDEAASRIEERMSEDDHRWLAEHNAANLGTYKFLGATLTVWKLPQTGQSLTVAIRLRGLSFGFGTSYANGGLTTGNSPEFAQFPQRPGEYVECLDIAGLEDLCAQHLASQRYLETHRKYKREDWKRPYEEELAADLRAWNEYLTSMRLWPLRIPYWVLDRPRKYWNKTVQEQIEQGMV